MAATEEHHVGVIGTGIYLDHNASCPIAPEVAAAMAPFLTRHFGNPSSQHWAGRPAHEAVEKARSQVARLLGARAEEMVFTSGGTEANNHAIKGVFFARREEGRHLVTTAVEHPAVLNPCLFLEVELDAEVTIVDVDGHGRVDPAAVEAALRPDTILVSVMHANNETGTINPVAEIAALARDRGITVHCDAAQSVGKIPVRVDQLGVDLLSVAGHKFYGPKGVGALYVRQGTALEPLVHGAGHEGGRRAGTENVLLAVALGAAATLAEDRAWTERARALRDRLLEGLVQRFGDEVSLAGHPTERLPNTLYACFHNRLGAEVIAALPGVAASTGSACHDGVARLSPVLSAMGLTREVGMGAVRFSLGRGTTADQIDRVLKMVEAQP